MNLFLQQILGTMTGFILAQLIIYVSEVFIEEIKRRKEE